MHTKLTTRLSHVSAWVESVRTNEALLKSVEKDYERMRRTVSFIDVFVLYELEPYLLTAGLCSRHVAEMCNMADKGCLVEKRDNISANELPHGIRLIRFRLSFPCADRGPIRGDV